MSISVILLFIIIMQKNGKLNVFGGCWCMYTKTLHHLIHRFFSVTEIWFISYKSITSYAREGDIELFHLPLHSPNGCNDHSRASAQSRAWSFFWVPHLGAGAQPLGLSTAAFPGALALGRVRNVATGTPTSPLMECWCLVQRCNLLCQGTGPVILYKWPY